MRPPSRNVPEPQPYDLSRHLAYVRKLHDTYPLNTYEKCRARLPDILAEIAGHRFPHQIAKELGESLFTVLRQNDIFFIGEPDYEDRDYLTRLQAVLSSRDWSQAGTRAAIPFFRFILSQLPASVFEEHASGFSVPLYTLLPDVADLIMRIQHFAMQTKHGDLLIFESLYKRLYWNTIRASGYELDEYDGQKLTFAPDSDLPSEQLIRTYLDHSPFADLLTLAVPFRIPDSVRNEHFLMVARTGSGKTQFVQHDILDNLARPDAPGMVVIDSQNQMIPKLERLRVAAERIVIVDPFDEAPPALNMFLSSRPPIAEPNVREALEANTLQQFAWIFSALDQELTGRQTTLFTFTARILLAMKANMQSMLDLMRIEKVPDLRASTFWPHIEGSDEQTRYFFDNRFCTNDYNRTKMGVADRLLGVLRVPSFNRMFMAPANRLDLYSLLSQRKLVVFNTHKSRLGNDASAVFGRYAISLYVRAAFERELDRAPPPAFLYVDEASEYFGKKDSSDVLFTQLRKYNCGTFVAFQDLSQLGEQQHTLIANTTTKLTGGLTVNDARRLAPDMRTTDQELMGTRKVDGGFHLMCHVANVTPRAIRITFPYGAAENAPKLTDAEYTALRKRNRELLSAPDVPAPKASSFAAPAPQRQETSDQQPPSISPRLKPGQTW